MEKFSEVTYATAASPGVVLVVVVFACPRGSGQHSGGGEVVGE